jgi:hypothetical protein
MLNDALFVSAKLNIFIGGKHGSNVACCVKNDERVEQFSPDILIQLTTANDGNMIYSMSRSR